MADPNGRYIIVTGKLYNIPAILAKVYVPIWVDDLCFRGVFPVFQIMQHIFLFLEGILTAGSILLLIVPSQT